MTTVFSLALDNGLWSLWKGGKLMTKHEVHALQKAPSRLSHKKLRSLGYVRYR